MSIRDGYLWKADPVLVELPPSVTTLSEALEWKIANRSENAGEIAYGKDIIVGRASHALSDGGHWVDLMNFHLSEVPKRPRIWIHTIPELFDAAFKRFTTPCSLDLANTGMYLTPSHPRRATASIADSVWHGPLQSFVCYDAKRGRPVKMTEHSWASMIVAAIIHNWRAGAPIDFARSGLVTLVNLRRYIDPSVERMNIGNCYSRVIPSAGAFSLDESLQAITERLRRSMDKQLKDWEAVKVLRSPLALAPPPGAPLMISNPGVIPLPADCIDALLQEVV
jgi:hypothetical protein